MFQIKILCAFQIGAGIALSVRAGRQGLRIFLFATAFIQPPIQRVPGAVTLGVKRHGREADTHLHLAPGLRMRGAIPPLPIYLHGVVLSQTQRQPYFMHL
jgi:hypothetical protein